ncbi:MAG: DUF262 domain-containing protein [Arcobacteraceae bacterium]|nr:DUF262 domain-containing protein [Arcobacteraceae bacterium]
MNASEIKFEEFFNKKKTNFIIPVYQRNYDWKDTQCKEFMRDIEALINKERETHLDNLICDEDHYKVKLIEQEFKKLMFGE